ncbi:MAG: hypothetical protein J6Y85_05045 [Alphaproteobacteria bacterium]|nr:hypothetical protein [Alphaproteobacteria bacterium]
MSEENDPVKQQSEQYMQQLRKCLEARREAYRAAHPKEESQQNESEGAEQENQKLVFNEMLAMMQAERCA